MTMGCKSDLENLTRPRGDAASSKAMSSGSGSGDVGPPSGGGYVPESGADSDEIPAVGGCSQTPPRSAARIGSGTTRSKEVGGLLLKYFNTSRNAESTGPLTGLSLSEQVRPGARPPRRERRQNRPREVLFTIRSPPRESEAAREPEVRLS